MTGRPEELDAREQHAWQAFMQMQESVRSRIGQELHAYGGFSLADYHVLAVLSKVGGGGLRALELGAELGWEKSRLHHQLTRMGKRGLIERKPGRSRAIHVELTDFGRATFTDAVRLYSRNIRNLVLDHLSAEQLDQLAEISRAILAAHKGNRVS